MPIRARTTRRKSPGWGKLDLRTRFCLAQACDPRGELTPADLEAGYIEYREQILADHIERKPGTRPPSWWKFDAPEGRRKIGQRPLYAVAGQTRFWHQPSDSIQPCRPGDEIGVEDVYESERDYLRRLNLLTEGEK